MDEVSEAWLASDFHSETHALATPKKVNQEGKLVTVQHVTLVYIMD